MIPDKVARAFAFQAEACRQLGSPFMGQICDLFSSRALPDTPLRQRIYDWPGDISPRVDSVPLRLCGAFHALAMHGDAGLGAVYPPHVTRDDALWAAVAEAFQTEAEFIDTWIDSPPQTNEVRRSAALIGVGHWLAAQYDLPIKISELGASGGLNLMWDRFAMTSRGQVFGPDAPALMLTPEWSGPLPPEARPKVVQRLGVDLNPLDPNDPADALRLQAYLWPDQPERMIATKAAIAANDVQVDQADAIDWLAAHLDPVAGQLHLIYHTIAWQYFPPDVQARGKALIEAAGAKATADTPLAWFGMEPDGKPRGAALTLRLWPGNLTIPMGRADFHGRWIDWTAPLPNA